MRDLKCPEWRRSPTIPYDAFGVESGHSNCLDCSPQGHHDISNGHRVPGVGARHSGMGSQCLNHSGLLGSDPPDNSHDRYDQCELKRYSQSQDAQR